MRASLLTKLFIFVFFAGSAAFGLDSAAIQELNFKVGHSGNPELQKALKTLSDSGMLVPSKETSRSAIKTTGDCLVSFRQGLLQSSLVRELMNKKLPPQVLEISIALIENSLVVKGRLDGPAFINPRFETTISVGLVKDNVFFIRIGSLRIAGFDASLFSGLLEKYILDAVKRAFPASTGTKVTKAPDSSQGAIVLNVEVNPEGFVSGLGKKAILTGIGITSGEFWLSFSTPRN